MKGQFRGKIRVGKRATEQIIYVVEGLHKSPLGQPAIQALHLLKRIGAVEKGSKPEELFPNLFTGLGKLGVECTTQLQKGALPVTESCLEEMAKESSLFIKYPRCWNSNLTMEEETEGQGM